MEGQNEEKKPATFKKYVDNCWLLVVKQCKRCATEDYMNRADIMVDMHVGSTDLKTWFTRYRLPHSIGNIDEVAWRRLPEYKLIHME